MQIDQFWKQVEPEYKVLEQAQKGGNGEVRLAVHVKSGQKVAIKHIDKAFSDSYTARTALREIKILRKLTQDRANTFTPRLLDIILSNS